MLFRLEYVFALYLVYSFPFVFPVAISVWISNELVYLKIDHTSGLR